MIPYLLDTPHLTILGFSIIVFTLGILMLAFTSKEFHKMSEKKPPDHNDETGARAFLADRVSEMFNDPNRAKEHDSK